MNRLLNGGAFALPLLLCAMPALADETAINPEIVALGHRADAHGPAGTMSDHVHKSGDLMIGLMWMHEDYGGLTQRDGTSVTDADVAAAGYSATTQSMTMDMAMLHIMWAPSDRVTFMVMPSWMKMGMTMRGLPAAAMAGGHTGHTLMPGQTMSHSSEGMGDTQFGALVSLLRKAQLSAHAGLMISAPTGSVSRKNANGTFVHYMMQGGSGTWDINPSFTLHGSGKSFGWGAQLGYVFRAEEKNASGFRFGDKLAATAWISKPLSPRFSLSARMAYGSEGKIEGHYSGAHNHSSPVDVQVNYGGQRLDAGLGANLVIGDRLRLGAEVAVPVWQKLNGYQTPRRYSGNINISTMF